MRIILRFFSSNLADILLLLYFGLTIFAGYLSYHFMSSKEFREQARNRLQQKIEERKTKIIQKNEESKLEDLIQRAGRPLGLTALRFQLFRSGALIFLFVYYVGIPWLISSGINYYALCIVVALLYLTSPVFKFSATYQLFNRMRMLRLAKMNGELFMLYDMLQSELSGMSNQQVNAYSMIKEVQPYFEYLDKPLGSLALNWKRSPQMACDTFRTQIPTDEAKALAQVISKMDQMSSQQALDICKGLSETFTTAYLENQKRKKEATKNLLSIPSFGTQLLIIGNLVIIITLEISDLIEFANLK